MTDKKILTKPDDIFKKAKKLVESSQFILASKLLKEGQSKFPKEILFYNLLAQISLIKKNHKEGIIQFKKSLQINKNQQSIMYDLAIALSLNNQLDEAIIYFNKSIKSNPENHAAYFRKAITLHKLGELDDSLVCYDKLIELNPHFADVYVNKAELLNLLGRTEDAISSYNKAIKINPSSAILYFKYGYFLYGLNLLDDALTAYQKSLELEKNNLGALKNIGYIYKEKRNFSESIIFLTKASHINPDCEVFTNIGEANRALGKNLEAIIFYDKAIELKSNYIEAHIFKAYAFLSLKETVKAILSFDQALLINKEHRYLFGERFHAMNSICDWTNYKNNLNWIEVNIKKGKRVVLPLSIFSLIEDPIIHKKTAEIYSNDLYPFNNSLGPINKYPKNKKIRIGYFSGDFREHPVAYLVAELFEMHDKSKFELFAFSVSNRIESKTRLRIEKSFDEFIDVANYSDQKVALLAREKEIDIAIDLGGYSKNSRTSIFSMRAAPIQINFLGYSGTTGADYIDYNIADKYIIPNESQRYYSEKIIYLPKCFLPCEVQVKPSKKIFSRKSEGLPESAFVFCCFHSNLKITPKMFKLWVNLLSSVKDSILWFPSFSPVIITNLKNECMALGMDENRLIFSSFENLREDHHGKIKLADIFLDCFPYGAHSTASDFLRSGIPIVTLRGSSFASQVASSLLINLNLSELVTTTQLDYESLAIKLANNPEYLKQVKAKLISNIKSSSLFNINEYTAAIEASYMKVYDMYHDGLEPDHVEV